MIPLAKTESGFTARRRNQNRSGSQQEADSQEGHASFDSDEELCLAMEMVTVSSDDGLESECE